MGVVIVLLMLLSALLLSWACTARPLLEQQPRGAVSLAVMVTGGQIRGRVMNTTQEPLLYTPLYLERYSVWSRRWDFVSLALAPSLEARLSPGEHADEYLAYDDERLLEPGHYRVCALSATIGLVPPGRANKAGNVALSGRGRTGPSPVPPCGSGNESGARNRDPENLQPDQPIWSHESRLDIESLVSVGPLNVDSA